MSYANYMASHLCSGAELRILIQRLARRVRSQRSNKTLSDAKFSVLFRLADEALGLVQLAVLEDVRPPSMIRTVNSLEKDGYVQRHPHNEDARRVEVTITEAGKRLVENTRQARTEWFMERFTALDPSDRESLVTVIPILRRLLEEE